MADSTKAPKGWLIAALIFFLLALLGCGVGIYGTTKLVNVASDAANTTSFGDQLSYRGTSSEALILLSGPAVCRVQGAAGESVNLREVSNLDVEANGQSFNAFLLFDTTEGQVYDVICGDTTGTGEYSIISNPGVAVLGSLAAGALASVVFFVFALVCFIVGLVRRSGWKKRNNAPPAAYGAPAGYAPPPTGAQNPYQQPPPGAPQQAPPPPAQPQQPPPPPAQPQQPPPPPQQPPEPPAPPAQ